MLSCGHLVDVCNAAIKLFTCIKIAWDRVENIFGMVLTTITTIWRAVLMTC